MSDSYSLLILPGDGIGPEIMSQVVRVLKQVDAPFEYHQHEAGEVALQKHGDLLPTSTIECVWLECIAFSSALGPTSRGERISRFWISDTFAR